MRLADLAAATLVGMTAVAAIAFTTGNPGGTRYAEEKALRYFLAQQISSRGVAWYSESAAQAICDAMRQLSNSTVTLSARVGGVECQGSPPLGHVGANLTIPFAGHQVVIEAWENEGQ